MKQMLFRSQTFRLAVILLSLVAAAGLARAEVIEQVLVKVNGEVFSKTDLENRQVTKLRDLQNGQKVDLKDPNNAELKKMLDQVTPQILVDAVDEMLVVQRGKELGYTLGDPQFKSIVDNIRQQNKLETDEQFQAALKQEGMTMEDLRKQLERQVIWQRVEQNEVTNKVAITDEEARAYYNAHLAEFTTPAGVTLREILIAPEGDPKAPSAAADEAARAKADGIRARALAGESFEKLAADFSVSASKSNGGLIGTIKVADLSADLRTIIEAMKPGDIAQPLRTNRGYQILKLESSTSNTILPFEQAREQISNTVLNAKKDKEFLKYLEKLRAQAIIEWKNPEIKKAYDEGIMQQAAQEAAPAAPPSH
jgi:peptidyl-prolyl cis-trans isomerase SurA